MNTKANTNTTTTEDSPKAKLMQLVMSNQATAAQKQELSKLLELEAQDEKKAEIVKKIDGIKALMVKEGVSLQDLIDASRTVQEPIFVWVDSDKVSHESHGAKRGKQPAWIAKMKETVTKEQALEMARNEQGKAWVNKIYG
jgi:hypothetical protein